MGDIYLDNNATTPVDPRVLEAMLPYLRQEFGNPSSRSHRFGWLAEEAVEIARQRVARVLHASSRDIVWTSGATEGNNTVLQGVARRAGETRRHIITSSIEHKSVIEPCRYLMNHGFEVTWLQPDPTGRIAPEQVADAIREDTLLVSLMLGHNELGTINPIAEIGAICSGCGVALHTDAAQACGKVPIDVDRLSADFLTLSGHKIYGPKGVGALYVRHGSPHAELQPLLMGGDQERGVRCGTLNVAGIVGCGAAAELAGIEMAAEAKRLSGLRDRLWRGLTASLDDILLNGSLDHRLPHTLNVAFLYVEGESLMVRLGDIAISSGSACTSASLEPSYVLRGIGLDDETARASIRFSLGRFNTEAEIDQTIDGVVETVTQLRRMNPRYELAGRRRSVLRADGSC